MSKKEGKKLFYTKLFDKCSTKEKETGEFEECCKDEVNKVFKKEEEEGNLISFEIDAKKGLKDVTSKDIFTRVKEIGEKEIHKKLDNIEKKLNDGK